MEPTKEKSFNIVKFLSVPTDVELGIFYFLLGINIAISTDAVIPLNYVFISYITLDFLVVVGVFRIIMLFIALYKKLMKDSFLRLLQIAIISAIIIIILGTNIDLAIRLKLSEKSLYEKVGWINSLPPDQQKRMIGTIPSPGPLCLFNVKVYDIDDSSESVWFLTSYGRDPFPPPFSLQGGIVYCKQGQPPDRGETTYEHLYGPWWRWLQDA